MTIQELHKEKQEGVRLYRDEIFGERDSPGWMTRHRLGPVHVQIYCRLCDKVLKDDLPEYGWLENDEYYKKHLEPHLAEHNAPELSTELFALHIYSHASKNSNLQRQAVSGQCSDQR